MSAVRDPFQDALAVIKDKRINPLFWVFSVLYLIGTIYVLSIFGVPSGRGYILIALLFLFPYMLISIFYLAIILSKNKKN
jgi:hypothetical protein